MKKLLTLIFALLLSVNSAFASYFPETAIKSSTKASYMASTADIVPVASTTDLFELYGSSSKTIKVLRVEVGYRGATAAAAMDVCYLLRRSTANSSGTSATLTNVKLDSNNAAATAVAKSYTANPTTGTLVGNITTNYITGALDGGTTGLQPGAKGSFVLFDANIAGQPIVLRGTGEGVVVNFNGTKPQMGTPKLSVIFYWTEE